MTIARALAVAAAAAIASGCSLFGGGDSTVEPPAELQEIEQTLQIERLWSTRIGRGTEGLRLGLRPSTDGVYVYAGAYDGRVAALDASNGREAWSVDTDAPLSAGPGYGNGVLAFGTSDGELIALEAETGEERWRVPVGSEVLAAPAVGTNVIALRSTDGRLRGFSITDGRQMWTIEQNQPPLIVRGDTKPEIAGQTVVAGFDNGRIGAYRLATGDPLWELAIGSPAGRSELDRLVDIGGDLQILGSDVYAVGYQGRAVAVDLNSGFVLWEQEMSSLAGLGGDANSVYVTNDVSYVVSLARSNGAVQWTQEALRLRDLTAPVRYMNTIVVGDFEGYLHFMDVDDGRFVARARVTSAPIPAAPIIVGRSLVVQAEDGRVAAYGVVEEELEEEG
ncbi:MAG TPA: outer membrane protein assembly factor BamB [Gammaproteobacteria bacterium]